MRESALPLGRLFLSIPTHCIAIGIFGSLLGLSFDSVPDMAHLCTKLFIRDLAICKLTLKFGFFAFYCIPTNCHLHLSYGAAHQATHITTAQAMIKAAQLTRG